MGKSGVREARADAVRLSSRPHKPVSYADKSEECEEGAGREGGDGDPGASDDDASEAGWEERSRSRRIVGSERARRRSAATAPGSAAAGTVLEGLPSRRSDAALMAQAMPTPASHAQAAGVAGAADLAPRPAPKAAGTGVGRWHNRKLAQGASSAAADAPAGPVSAGDLNPDADGVAGQQGRRKAAPAASARGVQAWAGTPAGACAAAHQVESSSSSSIKRPAKDVHFQDKMLRSVRDPPDWTAQELMRFLHEEVYDEASAFR